MQTIHPLKPMCHPAEGTLTGIFSTGTDTFQPMAARWCEEMATISQGNAVHVKAPVECTPEKLLELFGKILGEQPGVKEFLISDGTYLWPSQMAQIYTRELRQGILNLGVSLVIFYTDTFYEGVNRGDGPGSPFNWFESDYMKLPMEFDACVYYSTTPRWAYFERFKNRGEPYNETRKVLFYSHETDTWSTSIPVSN